MLTRNINRHAPTKLYRHFDHEGQLLYIGIAADAFKRLAQHQSVSCWFHLIATVTIDNYPTRQEARRAEKAAVLNERPLYNTVFAPNYTAPAALGSSRYKYRLEDSKRAVRRAKLFAEFG